MRRNIVMLLIVILFFAEADRPQSRAYAKFDSRGNTIGLYNLMRERTGCRSWQGFGGTIRRMWSEPLDSKISYQFTLDLGRRRLLIGFVLAQDELSRSVIEDIVNSDSRVSVRACDGGGRWYAEEITRK